MSTAEALPHASSEAKTAAEGPYLVSLGKVVWFRRLGGRVPGYYSRIIDGISYEGLKRHPVYEAHLPPYDIYLPALRSPPEPTRRPETEKRIPPFEKYQQHGMTAITEVIASAGDVRTFAEALFTGDAGTIVEATVVASEPVLSTAEPELTIFATAATTAESPGASAEAA